MAVGDYRCPPANRCPYRCPYRTAHYRTAHSWQEAAEIALVRPSPRCANVKQYRQTISPERRCVVGCWSIRRLGRQSPGDAMRESGDGRATLLKCASSGGKPDSAPDGKRARDHARPRREPAKGRTERNRCEMQLSRRSPATCSMQSIGLQAGHAVRRQP